jgi:hypothetical protein
VLFDQGTPVPLRRVLSGHIVSTAFEMGWAELSNGELSWPIIQTHVGEVIAAVDELHAGAVRELRFSE